MRIVLLCGYYYPDSMGGTEAYVQMLGQDLEGMGHDVSVAAPSADGEIHRYRHDGLRVYRYPISDNPTRAELRGQSVPEHFEVWENWLDTTQPDLVHMHSLTRGCSVAHAEAVVDRGIPMYVTIHMPNVVCPRGSMMRWGNTPCDGELRAARCSACRFQEKGLPKALAWPLGALSSTGIGAGTSGRLRSLLDRGRMIRRKKRRLQNWLESACRVVVVAEWLERVLVRNDIPRSQVTVSRHGLSPSMWEMQQAAATRRSSHDPSGPLRVGFVGRFTRFKGVHVLVDAVRHLPEDIRVRVTLYGIAQSSTDKRYLRRLKQRAAGDDRLQFCGPMTEENRVEAFASFDVLAVPSAWLETGPYTVLEAYAADIPVLGSNHSGIRERVDEGRSGVLVPSGDAEAWADALRELYEKHRSGTWTWQLPEPRRSRQVANEMVQLYRRHD